MESFYSSSEICSLNEEEVGEVSGGGFFDWISRVTEGYRIILFGIEVSDGIPNE